MVCEFRGGQSLYLCARESESRRKPTNRVRSAPYSAYQPKKASTVAHTSKFEQFSSRYFGLTAVSLRLPSCEFVFVRKHCTARNQNGRVVLKVASLLNCESPTDHRGLELRAACWTSRRSQQLVISTPEFTLNSLPVFSQRKRVRS